MSRADFTGSLPRHYDACLGPLMFEPYAIDLVERLPMTGEMRVLELACGTGIVTRRLREALPASATLTATDLNQAMVSYARAAVPLAGISWQDADAQDLPFPDASFDAVVCQFGIMFLPDTARGFAEAHRVLTPGGTLLANAWHSLDENPAYGALNDALAALFPDDPPSFLHTPYGYHDRSRILADAAAGGFTDVRLDDVRTPGARAIGLRLRHRIRARHAAQSRADRARSRSRSRRERGRQDCRRRDRIRADHSRPRRNGDHRDSRSVAARPR